MVAPLIALLLVLGFYPKPVLDVINPAVAGDACSDVGETDPAPDGGAPGGRQVSAWPWR